LSESDDLADDSLGRQLVLDEAFDLSVEASA
jgi:hypothetical protein